jgi:hypothetical protein
LLSLVRLRTRRSWFAFTTLSLSLRLVLPHELVASLRFGLLLCLAAWCRARRHQSQLTLRLFLLSLVQELRLELLELVAPLRVVTLLLETQGVELLAPLRL